MFKRFRSGLFFPSEIINYRFEKKITTILYLIILVLLSTIPSFIILFGDNSLNYADKRIIRDTFRDQELPYKIENYKLKYIGDEEEELLTFEITDTLNVVLTSKSEPEFEISPFSVDTYIILTQDNVYYARSLNTSVLFSYTEYPVLENFDFSGATNDEYDFWASVFRIINNQLDEYSLMINLINIGGLILVSLFSLLILGLIITSFQKLFNPYNSFGEIFQMMIYALTPYVIGQLLASLFGFLLFSFAGMLMTIIYASKLSRKLIKS